MEKPKLDILNIADFAVFDRAYQSLNLTAKFKTFAEDFIVEENIAVDFSGEGEHCWLYIKKQGCNTDWLAGQLARYCGVKKNAVSYAGLKDRHAVTSQWFSIQLPGLPTPEWQDFENAFNNNIPAGTETASTPRERIQILQCHRHSRKLQRGALKANAFTITLRGLSNTSEQSFALLKQRCDVISLKGVPNYFGAQRFGRHNSNLQQAEKLFANPRTRLSRHKRSLYLSAARSWLFNCILSERVEQHVWDRRLPGDVFMLNASSACFSDPAALHNGDNSQHNDMNNIDVRLARNEIHPTAVLWGKGEAMVTDKAAELESRIISQYPVFRDGLIAAGLQAQRRACRVVPRQITSYRQEDDFVISFSLPAGSYATMVLNEIFSELVTLEHAMA